MKIVISCNRSKLERNVYVTCLRQLELMRYCADVEFIGTGWPQRKGISTLCEWFNPDLIFLGADYDYQDSFVCDELERIAVPKAVCMQDYWFSVDERVKFLKHVGASIIVTRNRVGSGSVSTGLKHIVSACGYDETVFNFTGKEVRDIDVLICGRMGESYPFRNRVAEICRSISTVKVHELNHCGYVDRDETQRDFANLLRRSKMAIGCTGTSMRAHMNKMWEIPACGSVCITDINDLEPDSERLRKCVLELNPEWCDKKIRDEILTCNMSVNPEINRYASNRVRTEVLVSDLEAAVHL